MSAVFMKCYLSCPDWRQAWLCRQWRRRRCWLRAGVRQRFSSGVDAMSSQDHPHVRQATPLHHLRQGVQPLINTQHSSTHPRRRQAICLRTVWQGIPPEGQLQEPSTDALRTQGIQVLDLRQSLPPGHNISLTVLPSTMLINYQVSR